MVRSLLTQVVVLLVLAAANGARADAAGSLTEADRSAIRGVIEAQIAAFRADDGATAFSLASPSIQRQFGDPATFLAMVRTTYMPVYRPREVRFDRLFEARLGPRTELGGRSGPARVEPIQTVLLVGPELEVVTAYYVMEKQADGRWRIDGCMLRESPDRAL
jgi:Domain of unknown function (DUF4864)